MIELGFLAGVGVTFLLVAVVVLIMARLGMLRNHGAEATIIARLDAHEKWTKDKTDELNSATVQLGMVLEKLAREVQAGDGMQHGEEIPSGRELIGAVEGMGQDG